MKQGYSWALLSVFTSGLFGAGSVQAQSAPWQFRWQKGQTYTYKTEHVTKVAEAVEGNKTESISRINLIKRWQVVDLDAKGVATLQLSLTSMRNEQTRPNGEVLLFDSENPGKSTPELKEQMAKFVGQTLATIRIDGAGRIHEVKQGSASRYEAEPPFVVLLPSTAPREGQAWTRAYNVTLEPPFGTGDKFEAAQKYSCRKIEGGKATLGLTTEIKGLPESPREQLPLLQWMTEGGLVFDFNAGRLEAVRLQVDRTVENHQGMGSSYRFQSTFTEQLIDVK
ncbi:MAG: hypothetical protein HY040_15325 [Planctomycetes bacterium]|nr:hypothetical protein [Planctomycetota bacterium]